MTRVYLLEEYDEARKYWNRRAVVDNAITADRWRRNKSNRKFTDFIVYNHEEFCKHVEEVEAMVCTNPTPMK